MRALLRAAVLLGAAALGWFARSVFDDLTFSRRAVDAYVDEISGLGEDALRAFEARYAGEVENPTLAFTDDDEVQFVDGRPTTLPGFGQAFDGTHVERQPVERLDMGRWREGRRRRPGPPL